VTRLRVCAVSSSGTAGDSTRSAGTISGGVDGVVVSIIKKGRGNKSLQPDDFMHHLADDPPALFDIGNRKNGLGHCDGIVIAILKLECINDVRWNRTIGMHTALR